MSTSRADIIDKLHKLFPDGIIYAEEYKEIGYSGYMIHKMAKENHQTSMQWLMTNGFRWKETGYVEGNMRYREISKPDAIKNAFEIADYVFRHYPLAGEYIPSIEEEQLLYESAKNTVQKVLNESNDVTKQESVVLTLETIELLKTWSSDLLNTKDGMTFWNYIFEQYGFQIEHSQADGDRLYKYFRKAISYTLEHYNRFFASPQDTQRYYTSLLLHAMSPRQSIEAMFNILFNFYANDLEFQYVEDDISYKTFTKVMRSKIDKNFKRNEELQLRTENLSSGLQVLFKNCPGYMAVLCDAIVKRMDILLREEESEIFQSEKNYWDYLILAWYQKKSRTEHIQMKREKRQKNSEYVVASNDRIFVQYMMRKEQVGIFVPRIRLASIGDQRPSIKIYQDNILIFEREISVVGSEFCLTTESCFIALQEMKYDASKDLQISVVIEYLQENIYMSGEKMYRQYLLFDSKGMDKVPKLGTAYLFTGVNRDVDFSDDDEVYLCNHCGQLFRINLGEVVSIAVDGMEVFSDEKNASYFRHHASVRKAQGFHGIWKGKYVDIYTEPFDQQIYLPKGELPIRYRVSVDGITLKKNQYQMLDESILISSEKDDGIVHTLHVIDVRSDIVKYEYHYMICRGCRIQLDKPFYRRGIDQVEIQFIFQQANTKMKFSLDQEMETIIFAVPELGDMQLEVDLPVLDCTFMEQNGFFSPQYIWYKEIPREEVLRLSVPKGWIGTLMLGVQEIISVSDGEQFEIGNAIYAKNSSGEEMLWLAVQNTDGITERYKITTIVYTPKFLYPPLEIEDECLKWHIENNFIGDRFTQFSIQCCGPDKENFFFQAKMKDEDLMDIGQIRDGEYTYKISSVMKKGIFSGETSLDLLQGIFYVGNPDALKFRGKEIYLQDALCWDFEKNMLKNIPMRFGSGVLSDFVYQGCSSASGENIPAPCYQATMYFIDNLGRRISFNSTNSKDYELINPVTVWVINTHLLILQCVTEDTVYVDKKYYTIVNKSPNKIMSKWEQRERLETPDYFEYEVKERKIHA